MKFLADHPLDPPRPPSMPSLLRVKDWRRFQHYSDRAPNWIKLYRELLTDYEFTQLPDAQRWHLVGIWLLSAPRDGAIPNDPKWVSSQLMSTEKVDLNALVRAGFLLLEEDNLTFASSPCTAPDTHISDLEEKREEKKRGEKSREEFSPMFEQAWSLYPKRPGQSKQAAYKAWQARMVEKVDPAYLVERVRAYASYCTLQGTEPAYVLHAATFFGPSKRYEADYGDAVVLNEAGEVELYEADGVTLTEAGRALLGL